MILFLCRSVSSSFYVVVLVFDNGRSGFIGEHSCMDGTPTLRMNEFMLASLGANKIDLGPARTGSTGTNLAKPVELKFELDGRCQQYIDAACTHFDALVGGHEMAVRYATMLCQVC